MVYSKLYVDGKRDPRRRYIDNQGNIVGGYEYGIFKTLC